MRGKLRSLVLVHGLWNSSAIFDRLRIRLEESEHMIYAPSFRHDLGRTSIHDLALNLNRYINESCGEDTDIDLLGFSMGGIIGRIWLQQLGGASRTRRFVSIGCPHQGTFTAQLIPKCLFSGIADMKVGSNLLTELNSDYSQLEKVSCSSYFSRWDLMACPGWKAVLPIGNKYSIPVLTHNDLISHPKSIQIICRMLLSQ